MDKIIDYLKELDLSEVEAKLYLKLLQSGPTSVRDLAQTVDIKRTTTYFYIDQLVEKGLIMKIVRGSKKLVTANDPENLQLLIEKKLASAKAVQQGFPTILHDLKVNLPEKSEIDTAEIKYYKGIQGIKNIYEDALKATELRSYVKVESAGGLFSDNVNIFDQAFIDNPKLTVKEIIYDSPLATKDAKQILHKNDKYSFKLMPKELNLTSGDTLIYDGKVAIINYKGQEHGVILHNNDYYNNSKELFDFIWNIIQ
jgi:HTH-type transcriptional regulator, sugar sensing transcriptional regulator